MPEPPPGDVLAQIEQKERWLEEKLSELRKFKAEQTGKEQIGLTVPSVLARLKGEGVRYPTGFPTVDAKTCGGVPRGKMVVIVGKPGAGKTSIAIQMAVSAGLSAPDETAILAVFHDSGLEDACLTIAQQCGATREQAQNGEAVESVRFALGRLRLTLVDVNEPYALEDVVSRWYSTLPPGTVPILIVDSAQVVRTNAGDRERSHFDKVRVISDVVRSITNRSRAITFLVSQANRGAYGSKITAQDRDPIAAGSGSGNLEFMPDLHLFLELKGGRTVLRCQKNRLGEDQEWHVDLGNDKPRHRHLEIDPALIVEEIDEKREMRLRGVESRLMDELKKNPRRSKRQIRESMTGGSKDLDDSIKRLYERHVIAYEDGPKGANLWFIL